MAYNGIGVSGWVAAPGALSRNFHVTNNSPITLNPNSTALVGPLPPGYVGQTGIKFTNNFSPNYNSIFNNTMNITAPNTTAFEYGFYCNSSIGQKVECNNTSATDRGLEFNGSSSSKINRNTMSNHSFAGYNYNNAAVIGPQGSSASATDNVWSGAWGTMAAAPHMTFTQATTLGTTNDIWVRPLATYNPNTFSFASPPILANMFNTSPGRLSYTSTTLPYTSCTILTLVAPHFTTPTMAYDIISGTAASLSANPLQTNFILQNNLYRLLRSNSADSLLNDTTVNSFYTTNLAGSSFETFAQIDSAINIGDTLAVQSLLAGFTPTNNIETNYYNYYNWYLKYNDSTLSAADTLDIKTLGESCPYYDGDVVYSAISLYRLVNPNDIIMEGNCAGMEDTTGTGEEDGIGGSGERMGRNINHNSTNQNIINSTLSVYPNPANDILYFSLNGSKINTVTIELCNVEGKVIKSLFMTGSMETINTSNLSNGIYILRLTNLMSNEKVFRKVVVQHEN